MKNIVIVRVKKKRFRNKKDKEKKEGLECGVVWNFPMLNAFLFYVCIVDIVVYKSNRSLSFTK